MDRTPGWKYQRRQPTDEGHQFVLRNLMLSRPLMLQRIKRAAPCGEMITRPAMISLNSEYARLRPDWAVRPGCTMLTCSS